MWNFAIKKFSKLTYDYISWLVTLDSLTIASLSFDSAFLNILEQKQQSKIFHLVFLYIVPLSGYDYNKSRTEVHVCTYLKSLFLSHSLYPLVVAKEITWNIIESYHNGIDTSDICLKLRMFGTILSRIVR